MKNKIKIVAITAALLGATTLGAVAVSAQASPVPGPRGMTNLVSAIAQKFGLNQADVQAVVDQQLEVRREAIQAEREQLLKTKLASLVTAGKLTQAQSDLIFAKHEFVQTQMQALVGKTPEERRVAIDKIQADLKSWAESNNIPLQYLMFGTGRGMGHHMMGRGASFGNRPFWQ